jgi:hypothetical protein
MKKLLTLAFVAAFAFVGSAVYADETATAPATTEAPIVIGPGAYGHHGWGHHQGGLYGDQFAAGEYAFPGQKPSFLARIGSKLRAAKAAREARKAYGYGGEFAPYGGGEFAPKRKLFAPRNKAGFGGGFHNGFNGGYQEFPAEFQVGGYY